eukprot:3207279-Rhodomonas_salina.2
MNVATDSGGREEGKSGGPSEERGGGRKERGAGFSGHSLHQYRAEPSEAVGRYGVVPPLGTAQTP